MDLKGEAAQQPIKNQRSETTRSHILLVFLALAAIHLAANYSLVAGFGLYEDDWIYFSHAFDFATPLSTIPMHLLSFEGGRPFQYVMMDVGAIFFGATKSLVGAYLVTATGTIFGLFLWWRVLRSRFGERDAFYVAALTSLSTLHTVVQFLNGAWGFALALIFLMTAMLLKAAKSPVLQLASYAVAFGALLAYELYYPLFALAPWLARPLFADGRLDLLRLRHLILHVVACVAILLAYVLLREHLGQRPMETVSGNLAPSRLAIEVLRQMFHIAAQSFLYLPRLFSITHNLTIGILTAIFIAVVIAAVAAWTAPASARSPAPSAGRSWLSSVDEILLALFLILAAYPFAYFLGPDSNIAFVTRESRINVGACYGHALLIVAVLRALQNSLPRDRSDGRMRGGRAAAFITGAIVIGFASLASLDRVGAQLEYVQTWSEEKELLRQAITLSPDADDHSALLIASQGYEFLFPENAIGHEPHGWPLMIDSLFRLPGAVMRANTPLTDKPYLQFVVTPDWYNHLQRSKSGRIEPAPGTASWPPLDFDAGNIILLKWSAGRNFTRSDQQHIFDGQALIRQSPKDSKAPGFWDKAVPTKAMLALMPDVVKWFDWYKSQRAAAVAQPH